MDFILKNLDSKALQDIFLSAMNNASSSERIRYENKDDADKRVGNNENANTGSSISQWKLPKLTTEQWIWVIIVGGFILYSIYRILIYAIVIFIAYSIWTSIKK
jgi:hypothetical protein